MKHLWPALPLTGVLLAIPSTSSAQAAPTLALSSEFVDADSITDYNLLYVGRTYGAMFAGQEADRLRLRLDGAAMPVGSTITLSLSSGKFAAGSSGVAVANAGNLQLAPQPPTSSSASLNLTVTGSGDGAQSVLVDFANQPLDLTSAGNRGDLVVTSSAAGVSSSVKLATLARATSMSASGVINTFTPGSTTSTQLADLVIRETAPGALSAGVMGIKLPTNIAYDTTVTPTVTVSQNGAVVTGRVVSPSTRHYAALVDCVRQPQVFNLQLTTPSSDVPYVIEVSGLKAKVSPSTVSGDLAATLLGHNNAADGGTIDVLPQSSYPSALGAQPFSESVTVGTVGAGCICISSPPAVYSGPTSALNLNVSYAPPGNDLGKSGSIFVAAVLNPGGALYCYGSTSGTRTAAQWQSYTGTAESCLPYYSGALGQISHAPILQSADLRGLEGSTLYVGSGLADALSPVGTAFNSMINNGRYSHAYTVTTPQPFCLENSADATD